MSQGKVLSGILAGIAVGATLGILFSSKKGSKTRKKIMYKGKSYIEDVKNKFNHIVDESADKLGSIRKSADGLHVD